MFLKQLQVINFKNYSESSLHFSEKINCFLGDNGVGKTNILDAIYYLAFTKSYFNLQDNQNIKHNEEFFAVHGKFYRTSSQSDDISCIQKRNLKKQFRINGKDYDRLADHIGEFPVVMISPYDRDLINEGSDIRRKYIDSVISQFDRAYLDDLIVYNRILQQRNSLLKLLSSNGSRDRESLEIYDEQLVVPASRIYQKRIDFMKGFTPVFRKYFSTISNSKEEVDIVYNSTLKSEPLKDQLIKNIERDILLKHTTVGIHKDDLDLVIDGLPIKKFGSQGQQKSFVIALKLAQFDYTRDIKGYKPILLFDDIFDKLDFNRSSQIINLVSNDNFGQVFITDTQLDRINLIFKNGEIDHLIYIITNGTAKVINQNE